MNRGILAVYDAEYDFASRLVNYLSSRQDNVFDMYAFTDFDALKEFADRHSIDVLLVSEDIIDERIKDIGIKLVLVLSENEMVKDFNGYNTVEKYQPADGVFREVMEYVSESRSISGVVRTALSYTEIIGVYSPVKRCFKTTFALTLSHILSRKKRVLYINFEEYSGLRKILKADYIGDISDLIYFYMQNKPVLKNKMYAIKKQYGGFEYIPPMMFSNDIRNIDMDIWKGFINEIKECGDYDVVVLDLSDMLSDVFEILSICTEVYMPILTDFVSLAKVEEFEQVIKDRHKEELKDRIKKFEINGDSYIDNNYYDVGKIINGNFKQYVESVIGGMQV